MFRALRRRVHTAATAFAPSPLHRPSQEGARWKSPASRLSRRAQGRGRSRGGGGGVRGSGGDSSSSSSSSVGSVAAALDAAVAKHPGVALIALFSLAAAGGGMLHRDLKQDITLLRQDIKDHFAALDRRFSRLDSRFSRLEGWFVDHLSRGAQSGGTQSGSSGGSGHAS